jgi:hypothetical protein
VTPLAYRTGLAAAVLLRDSLDVEALEALFDGLDDAGDIMDASCVARLFAPRAELAHVDTGRLRAELLAKAAQA